MVIADIASIAAGALLALWLLASAVRTVVMPRPERVWLTMAAFDGAHSVARWLAARTDDPGRRHRVLGSFAPVVLIALPLIWSAVLVAAFAAIYWGLDVGSVADAIELSGSSLTTLGFVGAPTFATRSVAIFQALLGLGIVALMIGFLPTIYGTFSRREIAVGRLTTRAGEPPDPVTFISRIVAIDRLEQVGERWEAWEDWFDELGETHTTFPALVYFRSARVDRSWLSAAEAALDTASILHATELAPRTGQADTMIRSGYLALRMIADFFEIEVDADAATLSVTRADFDAALSMLRERGVVAPIDADRAWERFCGWRINYDAAVCGLRVRIDDGPSHWSLRRS